MEIILLSLWFGVLVGLFGPVTDKVETKFVLLTHYSHCGTVQYVLTYRQ